MQPPTLFTAIFEIYNLVSIIQSDRPVLGSMQERIVLLSSDLSMNFNDTFMSKRTHGDTSEHVYHDRQVVDAFTRAGYTLESTDEDGNGWAPLNKLKPTMRHAVQSNGTAVVVKLLHPGSNELRILQHLHSIKAPYNHTIPLLGTLKLNMGTFIILPEATPLDLGFALGMFRSSKVVDFSHQLIEGVAFLHRHGIAHLDIKPQNIVALRNQLFIIDFDISVRVGGPDALIDRWCGTPNWMAPEIGHQDGPKCLYSPIRADLWSCGLMLQYLARKGAVKEDPLTRQLLNKNARLRPLLH
ncbi:kinase-like domain-containing protein [Russula emetica]|nr:kinase-like domain-containing protein [Russula emetica]